jgi:beta-phosphoglucomutase-like phosphatase (HAD superfamily)
MTIDPKQPAFLFDLDGTLIDSVYQHVVAWREALERVGIALSVWKIHRRIGMSGGLFVTALLRELETSLDQETLAKLPALHADAYLQHFDSVRPLPGAAALLATLSENQIPWAIATSGGGSIRAALARAVGRFTGHPAHHPRSGPLRQAGPGPVPDRRRPDRGRHP